MSQAHSFRNARVLLTGANRGIGAALLEELLDRGVASVHATARNPDDLARLGALDARIHPVLLDVTRPEHIRALRDQLTALDVVINNAGTATASGYQSAGAVALAEQEMQTNYFGPLRLVNAVLDLLRASDRGGIINVSSIAGLANFPVLGPYSASKAAVHFLTQGLRAELRDTPIHVLGVYPGPVDTRMAQGIELPKAAPHDVAQRILAAWENGERDVFPDEFSTSMAALFHRDPRALELAFAG